MDFNSKLSLLCLEILTQEEISDKADEIRHELITDVMHLETEVERYKTALQKISEGGDHCGDGVDLMNIASKFLAEE